MARTQLLPHSTLHHMVNYITNFCHYHLLRCINKTIRIRPVCLFNLLKEPQPKLRKSTSSENEEMGPRPRLRIYVYLQTPLNHSLQYLTANNVPYMQHSNFTWLLTTMLLFRLVCTSHKHKHNTEIMNIMAKSGR